MVFLRGSRLEMAPYCLPLLAGAIEGIVLLLKMTVRCAIVAAAMLVGCSCKAFVLPPLAPNTPLSKATSYYSNACLELDDEDIRFPIGTILSSQLQQTISTLATAAALFITALASPININVNTNQPAITIEKSQAYALNENQLFISDVWFKVTTQYFDQSFNGMGESGWRAKEKEAFQAVEDTGPDDDELVVDAIKTMLSALGDPYTRFLPKEKYEVLTAYATGGSGKAGIGVQLLEDPRTKHVMVMKTISGGPADLAGIQAGDAILKIEAKHGQDGSRNSPPAKICYRGLENFRKLFFRRPHKVSGRRQ